MRFLHFCHGKFRRNQLSDPPSLSLDIGKLDRASANCTEKLPMEMRTMLFCTFRLCLVGLDLVDALLVQALDEFVQSTEFLGDTVLVSGELSDVVETGEFRRLALHVLLGQSFLQRILCKCPQPPTPQRQPSR